MKKIRFILILILFSLKVTYAQDLFLKTYDFGTVEDSYQIAQYNGRIFVNTATYCGVECSYLAEIDYEGTILWKTEVPDIDIASGSMVIANDTITVTGNNAPLNTVFRMAHFTLDGEKIGPTFEIEHPTKKYTRMFQLTTQFFNGKYVVCGPGVQGDTSWSLIYVVNSSGEIDTLITLEPTNHESDLWDSYIDRNGRLTTYYQVEFAHSEVNYRKIIKFDTSFDIVWSYTSEFNDDNEVIPRGCELLDGRLTLTFVNPEGSLVIHSVRAINQDSTVDWQHDYQTTGSRSRYILRLKSSANGDILGCGQYGEIGQIPKIYGAPWLFRMSPNGDILWERTYVDIDTNTMEARFGALFDFVELENGDVIAVGNFKYEDNDMLIMRVDSNGCLNPDDCHEVNILTWNEGLPLAKNVFELYPNPVESILYIHPIDQYGKIDYEILESNGKRLMRGSIMNEQSEINVDNFPSGIYYLNLNEKGRLLGSQRFVKVDSNR